MTLWTIAENATGEAQINAQEAALSSLEQLLSNLDDRVDISSLNKEQKLVRKGVKYHIDWFISV